MNAPDPSNTFRFLGVSDRRLVALASDLAALRPDALFTVDVAGQAIGRFQNAAVFEAQFPGDEWEDSRRITKVDVRELDTVRVLIRRVTTKFVGGGQEITPSEWEMEASLLWGENAPPNTVLEIMSVL